MDIYKSNLREIVNYLVDYVHCRFLLSANSDIVSESPASSDKLEVVINHKNEDDKEWAYYIVNHTSRSVFWLDDLDLKYVLEVGEDRIRVLSTSSFYYEPLICLNVGRKLDYCALFLPSRSISA